MSVEVFGGPHPEAKVVSFQPPSEASDLLTKEQEAHLAGQIRAGQTAYLAAATYYSQRIQIDERFSSLRTHALIQFADISESTLPPTPIPDFDHLYTIITAGTQAVNTLVTHNMGIAATLAEKAVKRYGKGINDYNDYVIIAISEGLLKAAATFNPTKGKFSTHAWEVTDHALKDAYRNETHSRRVVSEEDITMVPLDMPLGSDSDEITILDTLASDDPQDNTEEVAIAKIEQHRIREEVYPLILTAIEALPPKQKVVIGRCVLKGEKQAVVKNDLGVKSQTVNLYKKRGLKSIRKVLLPSFSDTNT